MALQAPIDDISLPSVSQWKKVHLDRLNAEYDRHLVSDFSFSNTVIPADVQRRIAPCDQANQVEIDFVANELAKVNDSNEITVDFEFDSSEHPSISLFFSAFYNLQDILRKMPEHFSLEATLPHTPTNHLMNQQHHLMRQQLRHLTQLSLKRRYEHLQFIS
jgi:hypothetical protein